MEHALVVGEQPFDLFILLILGHFVADYPLQGDKMAVEKCPGKDVTLNWRWWLSAHAGTHGFFVAMLTGIPLLGLAEMAWDCLSDLGHCRLGYKLIGDQAQQWRCKWAGVSCVMI